MVSVAILGSCVTRDAFALPAGSAYEIDEYFARSALASATAELPFIDFDDSAIESPFQRRIVALDHSKTLLGHVAGNSFDVFIYDMIDERFDLVQHDGRIATRSNEFTLGTSATEPEKRIASGSDEFFTMWETGWERLIETLTESGNRAKLRIHAVYWATASDTGPFSKGKVKEAKRANEMLDLMYSRMSIDLEESQFLIPDPRLVVGASDHKWGPAPFHFADAYYEDFLSKLRASL